MNTQSSLAALTVEVRNLNEKYDRLMNLLTPRIEKWDATSTQVEDMKEDLRSEKESLFHPKKLSWVALVGTIVGHIFEALRR